MTRINGRLLVQNVDGDVVILDEQTGAEIVIPRLNVWAVAASVFIVALAEPDTPADPYDRELIRTIMSAMQSSGSGPCLDCTAARTNV